MRENLTLVFCVLAAFAVVFGRGQHPPTLTKAYEAFEQALGRGDNRRAARYGEMALAAAPKSSLLDATGIARLALQVGDVELKAGNAQRAHELFELASQGLGDGTHEAELAHARRRLEELDHRFAGGAFLRGTAARAETPPARQLGKKGG